MPTVVNAGAVDHVASLAQELLTWFPPSGRILVAFSGGADSALVLAAAARAAGPDRISAATAVSASVASEELAQARQFARSLSIEHLEVPTREMMVAGYRANGPDRCYFCKSTLLDELVEIARRAEIAVIATGTNADDMADPFRPGIRAGRERGIRTPLADLGLGKEDVRSISRRWGLVTWDKPATPCLSSRIAYGIEISPARLQRVEAAERGVRHALAARGLRTSDLRVRDLGDHVRVEVDAELVETCRQEIDVIRSATSKAGFGQRSITIAPFTSGSLNHIPSRHRSSAQP